MLSAITARPICSCRSCRRRAEPDRGLRRTVRRENLDHPAGGVAVNRAKGPRRTSMRSAVSRLKDAACPCPSGMVAGMPSAISRMPRTPKCRSGAETARRDLQVLRVILAVLHDDARNGVQRLREVHLRAVFTDRACVDGVDRHRQIETLALDACRGDGHAGSTGAPDSPVPAQAPPRANQRRRCARGSAGFVGE